MPSGAPISIWDLFQHADLVVKLVMVGLLVASVAVWAIAIEKLILYSRTRRAMDGFEQAFWSGQSLEELYRALASRPTHSMAALFVAAMREWKRSLEGQPRSFGGCRCASKKSWTSPSSAKSPAWSAIFWCWRRLGRPAPLSACSGPFGAS